MVTSNGAVDGNEVIFDITRKCNGVVSYINYQKGDENRIQIEIFSSDSSFSSGVFYSSIMLGADGETIEPLKYIISAGGLYRIPFPIGSNEDQILVIISFLDNAGDEGTVDILFREDSPYR